MKQILRIIVLSGALVGAAKSTWGQGTAFTYQGRLNDAGSPANGSYDLKFSVYDAVSAGSLVAGPLTNTATGVSNGLFTVTLDFGSGVFTGPSLWLDISVRTNGSAGFTAILPRQALTPSPYAIFSSGSASANAVTTGSITSAGIAGGQVVKSLNGLFDNITLAPGTNVSITPSGNTLLINSAGAGGSGIWSLNGASAYYNGGNVGIGTATPGENLSIAGVSSYNTGLKLTGNTTGGAGLALESTAAGGHKYAVFSANTGEGVGAGGFGVYDDTVGAYRLAINAAGKVGIGTMTPAAALEVHGEWDGANGALTLGAGVPSLRLAGGLASGNYNWVMQVSPDGPGNLEFLNKIQMVGFSYIPEFTITPFGYVGIGTVNPTENLTIAGVTSFNGGLKLTGNATAGTGMALENTSTGGHKYDLLSGGSADGIGAGAFGIYDETAASYRLSISPSGTVSVRVLTITGGADVAEPFALADPSVPKGAVVVIDEEHPGQLKLSTRAYDTRVAGVVSGANGIHPGLALHQDGVNDGGENVALSGRVYVQADAAYGAIRPGDLLTTSDTAGHAMRMGDPARAQGAILGKAMSRLDHGTGLVLVLVSLQ